ncbi:type II toxin-antitoxin system RelE/ParE family toxin [Neisseria bergeri]|uniref:type II toxin-antitoxin system RelE/ParE family toxin n=1 Tax=Neisseria bergeri TaxID=1906581 RepID=UPI000D302C5F|nr:type II toxin-antitoxin system RelE/ParE family toxin [Neisseria bergeri]
MRIFKNQWIVKFAKKHKISDSELLEAVERADNGLTDADLGGGVIKQRIARQGQGRSGGYRSLILFKQADRAFFVYAFAKNDRENISDKELAALKDLARYATKCNKQELEALIIKMDLQEI